MNPMELSFFHRKSDYTVIERRLPHWVQPGVVTFLTWRTEDSIPADVLNQWRIKRFQWLRGHSINPHSSDWKNQLQQLEVTLQIEFHRLFSERWHNQLDAGHGACALKRSELSEIVESSLHRFDGDRYELLDFIVMPNHVHLLAVFAEEHSMLSQCDSWKHYTAREINRKLKTRGRFWQPDAFDHLVRSEEHFKHLRDYIARNGTKAGLQPGEYRHYSKLL
jgi:putative transposase